MGTSKTPKAVLFDIGGVIVSSPFQAILDYERKNKIPSGWINFAIRHNSPNGAWQRLERGEMTVGDGFFQNFSKDLNSQSAWQQFQQSGGNTLRDKANPSQLGDHVSLKAEKADSEPTHDDRGAQKTSKSADQESSRPPLAKLAKDAAIGDPVSLKAEKTDTSPTEHDRGAKGAPASDDKQEDARPSLSKLAKNSTIGDPVSLESEDVVEKSGKTNAPQPSKPSNEPSKVPKVDGEALFWSMMSASRQPDPYIFPALERLKNHTSRPIMGALSNTVKYAPDHEWSKPGKAFSFDPASFFDVYVASSDVGMRKPSKEIYDLAMQRLSEQDKQRGGQGLKPEEVVFLDDIGENLKVAKEIGMRTIKVQLGKTWRAVKELEGILGADLMDEKTRRAKL